MTATRRGRGRPPAALDLEAIARAYQAGQTLDAIAATLRVSNTTVLNKLKLVGVPRRARHSGRKGGRNPFIQLSQAKIELMYSQGLSTRSIAERMNCSAATVARRLAQAGIPLRRDGWTWPDTDAG